MQNNSFVFSPSYSVITSNLTYQIKYFLFLITLFTRFRAQLYYLVKPLFFYEVNPNLNMKNITFSNLKTTNEMEEEKKLKKKIKKKDVE